VVLLLLFFFAEGAALAVLESPNAKGTATDTIFVFIAF
jgi:hypothetical protein